MFLNLTSFLFHDFIPVLFLISLTYCRWGDQNLAFLTKDSFIIERGWPWQLPSFHLTFGSPDWKLLLISKVEPEGLRKSREIEATVFGNTYWVILFEKSVKVFARRHNTGTLPPGFKVFQSGWRSSLPHCHTPQDNQITSHHAFLIIPRK